MALTSDHGVAVIPQTVGAARIATEDIRERIEETLVKQFGGPSSGAHYVANVTFTNAYLADGVWNRVAADEEAWRRVEAAVVGMPGVARLLRVDRLESSSPDAEIRAAALRYGSRSKRGPHRSDPSRTGRSGRVRSSRPPRMGPVSRTTGKFR